MDTGLGLPLEGLPASGPIPFPLTCHCSQGVSFPAGRILDWAVPRTAYSKRVVTVSRDRAVIGAQDNLVPPGCSSRLSFTSSFALTATGPTLWSLLLWLTV